MQTRLSAAYTLFALVFITVAVTAKPAISDELPDPAGRIILEISGAIQNTNAPGIAKLDADMLGDLPAVVVQTKTPWTDGVGVFEGPLAKDVMSLVGAAGDRVLAVALNDYSVEIPMSDFMLIDAIFATKLNGETMGVRDRGPIWIIFPWDTSPDLRNELYYSRSIWQVRSIKVFEE